MKRSATLTAIVILILAIPEMAMASVSRHSGHFDVVFEDPFGAELCGVEEFTTQISGVERVTEFYDEDGELVEIHANVTATAEVRGDGELLAWDNYGFNVVIDLVNGTETYVGSPWNTHVRGEGVVVNDSGRLVISLEDGSILEVRGPHQAFFTPPPAITELICETVNG